MHITIHGDILRHGQNRLGYAVCVEAGSRGVRVRFLLSVHHPMATLKVSNFASVLHDLLEWSAARPMWQRDALRRIVRNDSLTDTDVLELTQLCLLHRGAAAIPEPPLTADPLTKSHLPQTPGAKSCVTLVAIENLQNVNRLPSDQRLAFIDGPGLTVVYGENGTGKTGFARVVKNACRTRGAQPAIRPNAFTPVTNTPASANIIYRVDNAERNVSWLDRSNSIGELSNIFVFDGHTGVHYLTDDGPTTFTPRGLHILPTLSAAADKIGSCIDTFIKSTEQANAAFAAIHSSSHGEHIGRFIDGLASHARSSDTFPTTQLSPDDLYRLSELNDVLASTEKHHAQTLRAAAGRITQFASTLDVSSESLSDDKMDAARSLVESANSASQAALSFSSGSFDSSYLPGTGGDAWRLLWDSARDYATSIAYPGRPFPPTEDAARCVLCQQDLDGQALTRMTSFDAFCRDQSLRLAEQGKHRLVDARRQFDAIGPLTPAFEAVQADLSSIGQAALSALKSTVDAYDSRLLSLKSILATQAWSDLPSVPAFSTSDLRALADNINARAALGENAHDPSVHGQLILERNQLLTKQWIAAHGEDINAQIERHRQLDRLKQCKRDTSTKSITEKHAAITHDIVTEAYCSRFQEELLQLGLNTLMVRMQDISARKGQCKFGLRIPSVADAGSKVRDIASDGEQRCIALAAFLAELSQTSHKSTLVFDDPVSSLDHRYRDKIAIRLVKESKSRQIVVFTHDTVFLASIEHHANEHRIRFECRYLEWHNGLPGRCNEGLPWDHNTPQDKIDKLQKLQRDIASQWQLIPTEKNVSDIRSGYGLLRATIERIVEREVLGNVIQRYSSYINIKNLDKVIAFDSASLTQIKRIHKRCCDVTNAHDPASGGNAPVPSASDFKNDIDETHALLEAIRAKHKSVLVPAAPLKVASASASLPTF